MRRGAATISWGVALSISLALPLHRADVSAQGHVLPVAPGLWPRSSRVQLLPPPSISGLTPYRFAWTETVAAEGSLMLAFTASSMLLGGSGVPLRALSIGDGDLQWTAETGTDTTPVVDGDVIFTVSDRILRALDGATGRTRWTAPVESPAQPPTARNGRLLVATNTEIRAYRVVDGMELWRQNLAATAIGRVAASDAVASVPLSDGTLAGVALETGRLLWRRPVDGTPLGLTAAFNHLYFGTSAGLACAHGEDDGQLEWCFRARVPATGPPAADNDRVYFTFLDNSARVLDRRRGAMLASPALGSRPAAGPALGGSLLIVPVVTSEFVVLDLGQGLKASRVSLRDQLAPSLQASAISADGRSLAMLTVSSAGRAVTVFTLPPAQ